MRRRKSPARPSFFAVWGSFWTDPFFILRFSRTAKIKFSTLSLFYSSPFLTFLYLSFSLSLPAAILLLQRMKVRLEKGGLFLSCVPRKMALCASSNEKKERKRALWESSTSFFAPPQAFRMQQRQRNTQLILRRIVRLVSYLCSLSIGLGSANRRRKWRWRRRLWSPLR